MMEGLERQAGFELFCRHPYLADSPELSEKPMCVPVRSGHDGGLTGKSLVYLKWTIPEKEQTSDDRERINVRAYAEKQGWIGLDPSKKYLLIVDPREIDIENLSKIDIGVDAVLIPMIPLP